MSYRLPQDPLSRFLDDCRQAFAPLHHPPGAQTRVGCALALVVDEWEGLHDLARLATHVDLLSFSPRRRGFGVARTAALQEAALTGAPWCVLVDADGQHAPHAIADMLAEVERSDWHAAIPQRTLIHLPLEDEGGIDRVLAEAFEAWVVARAAGRPHDGQRDLQPGVFVLGPEAAAVVLRGARARRYEWDLEAAYNLLGSGLRIGFPEVASRPQTVTWFNTLDSCANLRFLADLKGSDGVRAELDAFQRLDWVANRFSALALANLRAHLEEALAS